MADPDTPPPGAELSPLGRRLDALATALFYAASVVVVFAVGSALIISSTSVDTFGLVDQNVESQSRTAIVFGALAAGLAAAGILAGLGGILKALVRRDDL